MKKAAGKMFRCEKRHFQLLEVLIAMVLITLCAAPALKIYTNMYRQQVEIVHHYQADHLIHQVHAKIIENIYKHAISFDEILMGDERSFEDNELAGKLKKIGYKCSYTIKKLHQRKLKKEEFVRYLCALDIGLTNQTDPGNNRTYHYEHFLQGPPIQGILLNEEDDNRQQEVLSVIDEGAGHQNPNPKNSVKSSPRGANK